MRIFHCKTDVKLNSAYPDYIYNILTFTQIIIIINNRRCHCHFSIVIVIIITSAIVVIVAILQNLYNKN